MDENALENYHILISTYSQVGVAELIKFYHDIVHVSLPVPDHILTSGINITLPVKWLLPFHFSVLTL